MSITQYFLSDFSERLKEERIRLNQKQNDIAKVCEISARTWGKYEHAESLPDASVLSKLSYIGFDVLYLLTGNRSPVIALNLDEQILLARYRRANDGVRFGINSILETTT